MAKRKPITPREAVRFLEADGWTLKRRRPGDHRQFAHPIKKGKVTIDMGVREIPIGTLRSVYRQAGLDW